MVPGPQRGLAAGQDESGDALSARRNVEVPALPNSLEGLLQLAGVSARNELTVVPYDTTMILRSSVEENNSRLAGDWQRGTSTLDAPGAGDFSCHCKAVLDRSTAGISALADHAVAAIEIH